MAALTQVSAVDLLKKIHNAKTKKDLPVKELFPTSANIAKLGSEVNAEELFDLVVYDEAHQLWDFRRGYVMNKIFDMPMIQELFAAHVSAFF